MSAAERDFSNYRLGDNVYELADGLLPEMAGALGYEHSERPDEENLRGFIGHIGPAKWLQDNIGLARERLDTGDDAVTLAADWTDRSGVLTPLSRSFVSPEVELPSDIDVAFITGGVARWMLRRGSKLVSEINSGRQIGKVFLPVGGRPMRESEHDLVAQMAAESGSVPTERDFARAHLLPMLGAVGTQVEILDIESQKGGEIMDEFVRGSSVTSGTVLAVGNAPSAIQSASEFRLAAREATSNFDAEGSQLFVLADSISVARQGEGPATHQNPFTALGQIARNAMYLHRNQV